MAIVLHDQNVDISKSIEALDERMSYWGYPMHAIHTAHNFYRKAGFKEIPIEDLPFKFDYPDRNSIMFIKEI